MCAADAAADEAIEDEDDDVLIDCCIIIFCAVVPIPFIPIMMMIEWESRPLPHVPHHCHLPRFPWLSPNGASLVLFRQGAAQAL